MNTIVRSDRLRGPTDGHAGFCRRLWVKSAALWLGLAGAAYGATLSEVPAFAPNPGSLRMFKYVPDNLLSGRPLVVALHGCTQSAATYDDETGWRGLADRLQFAVLLPQQRPSNNFNSCFNWFEPRDSGRDQGEARSIKTMIDRMGTDHAIDPQRVFVTGLSAGGAMTAIMLATYPDVFAGGAIIAGLPYKCATSASEALNECMRPGKNLTPARWGALVRAASSHPGPWPKVSIWHGDADPTVAPVNAAELIDQWTDVHGIDRVPDVEDTVAGHRHQVFQDPQGLARVESYTVRGMGHATPIDPGPGAEQCGTVAAFIVDADICSSLRIVRFWGLEQVGPEVGPVDPTRAHLIQGLERIQGEVDALRTLINQLP